MGGTRSRSGVEFFPGQKEKAGQIFEDGGLFDQILAGRPDVASRQAQTQGLDLLGKRNAMSGIDPSSGIAQAGRSNFLSETAAASEGQQLNRILAFSQPAGSTSRGAGGPLGMGKG